MKKHNLAKKGKNVVKKRSLDPALGVQRLRLCGGKENDDPDHDAALRADAAAVRAMASGTQQRTAVQ
jgi:hypothetical protein